MGFPPRFGEPDLLLTLAQGRHFLVCKRAMAARTGDAKFKRVALPILSADWVAAGMAELIVADFQTVADADTPVENETLTLPGAVLGWHVLKVFQDAAL